MEQLDRADNAIGVYYEVLERFGDREEWPPAERQVKVHLTHAAVLACRRCFEGAVAEAEEALCIKSNDEGIRDILSRLRELNTN